MSSLHIIDKLAWIRLRDKKIVMTLSRGKDTWYIPGGKREVGESDREALCREIREELAVEIDPATTHLYGVFEAQAHGQSEGVIVRMTCYTGDYTGELQASSEIEKIDYFTYDMHPRSGVVDKIIFDDLKEKGLLL
jgi:8-oxo-dGTP diphosphatase